MARLYFHFQNGVRTLDHDGVDLPDLLAVQTEAARTIAAIMSDDDVRGLWSGQPLRLWVTDGPNDAGKTLLALRVTAEN